MHSKILARLGALTFVVVAISAAAVQFLRDPEPPLYRTLEPPPVPAPDPRREVLRQCRDMGEAAIRDPVCLRIWADGRNVFLSVPGSVDREQRNSQEGR